jgi:hypothetical protein
MTARITSSRVSAPIERGKIIQEAVPEVPDGPPGLVAGTAGTAAEVEDVGGVVEAGVAGGIVIGCALITGLTEV